MILLQIKEVVRRDLFISHLIDRLHDLSFRRSFVQAILGQRTLPQRNACGLFNGPAKSLLADFVLFQIFLYFHVDFYSFMDLL